MLSADLTPSGRALAQQTPLELARQFTQPLLSGQSLDTGEDSYEHAGAVVTILQSIGADESTQAAVYLSYACAYLSKPKETLEKAFGPALAQLSNQTHQLNRLQRDTLARAQEAPQNAPNQSPKPRSNTPVQSPLQVETVRKMLLAFSQDLRVVVIRLASRLQTLRYFAAQKMTTSPLVLEIAKETLAVLTPLANRLGLGRLKWEMEDLSLRYLEPEVYQDIARKLEDKRIERERKVADLVQHLQSALAKEGLTAQVEGRAKHIYSIVKKMRGKNLAFHQVMDIRALRIIAESSDDCYRILAWLHAHYQPVEGEFDDYIARPKANGYQSIHTVVQDQAGLTTEIQIRSHAMHALAESGVAAHWVYKEAGQAGYKGVSAHSDYEQKIALLRQLLAWEQEVNQPGALASEAGAILSDRIYVLTPQARVIDLPRGSTPIDFAYALHTQLGHRCRGAKINGVMLPLSTPLENGQTVEIFAAKEGGPSRDWLNPELRFLASPSARAKVRAWFNSEQKAQTILKGREALEKLLQREGKTSTNIEQLAHQLGFNSSGSLFEKIGKDEFSLKTIEAVLRPSPPLASEEAPKPSALTHLLDTQAPSRPQPPPNRSNSPTVVVEGVDTLLTQLAKCCHPLPPEPIAGYVSRGKGITIHRQNCADYQRLAARALSQQPGRLLRAEWLKPSASNAEHGAQTTFSTNIRIHALDRHGLLRDISDVFAKEKTSVSRANTHSLKNGTVRMQFTAHVRHYAQMLSIIQQLQHIAGVQSVERL